MNRRSGFECGIGILPTPARGGAHEVGGANGASNRPSLNKEYYEQKRIV